MEPFGSTQRPGKHLAVHASELVVKPDLQILRRYRRPLLLRLEHTHRPTLEDHVHRATRLGSSRSLNLRIGISRASGIRVVRSDGLNGEVSDPRVSGLRPVFVAALAAAMLPACSQSCDT